MKVVVEGMGTQHKANLCHADIRRVADDLVGGDHAVARSVADDSVTRGPAPALTVDGCVPVDLVFLHGNSHDEGLERGAGLHGVLRHAVAVNLGTELLEAVRVEEGVLCPRQNFAARNMHHKGTAPAGFRVLYCPGDGLLGEKLHLHIDGQGHVIAMRIFLALLAHIEAAAHGIALHNLAGRHAPEILVEGAFQPFESVVVKAHETEQLPGHVLEGVNAFVLFAQADAGEAGLADGLRGIVIDFALDPQEVASRT